MKLAATAPSTTSTADELSANAGGLYRWYVVALLGAIYFVAFVDRLALSLLVEPIKRDLHVSDTGMGVLFGFSFAATLAVISIPLARLADGGNRRNLIAVAVAAWSLLTALSGLARSFGALVACRIGLAVGEAGLKPAALSMITDLFPARGRALPLSVYLTAGIAGAAGSLLVLGAVIHAVTGMPLVHLPGFGDLAPWRTTLIIIGLPTTLLALLLALTVREPARATVDAIPASASAAFRYLRDRGRAHFGFFFAGALMALLSISATAWYPTFLIRQRGLSPHEIGSLFGTISIASGVSGSLLVPLVAHRWAVKRPDALRLVAIAAVVVGAPCFALGAWVSDLMASMLLMGAAHFCLIGGINIPAVAVQQAAPGRLRSQLAALYFLGVNLGGLGTGPVLTAQVAKHFFGGEHGLGPALASLAIVMGPLAVLALLTVPKPATPPTRRS